MCLLEGSLNTDSPFEQLDSFPGLALEVRQVSPDLQDIRDLDRQLMIYRQAVGLLDVMFAIFMVVVVERVLGKPLVRNNQFMGKLPIQGDLERLEQILFLLRALALLIIKRGERTINFGQSVLPLQRPIVRFRFLKEFLCALKPSFIPQDVPQCGVDPGKGEKVMAISEVRDQPFKRPPFSFTVTLRPFQQRKGEIGLSFERLLPCSARVLASKHILFFSSIWLAGAPQPVPITVGLGLAAGRYPFHSQRWCLPRLCSRLGCEGWKHRLRPSACSMG